MSKISTEPFPLTSSFMRINCGISINSRGKMANWAMPMSSTLGWNWTLTGRIDNLAEPRRLLWRQSRITKWNRKCFYLLPSLGWWPHERHCHHVLMAFKHCSSIKEWIFRLNPDHVAEAHPNEMRQLNLKQFPKAIYLRLVSSSLAICTFCAKLIYFRCTERAKKS